MEKKLKRLLELLLGIGSLCLARIVALVHHEPFMFQNFTHRHTFDSSKDYPSLSFFSLSFSNIIVFSFKDFFDFRKHRLNFNSQSFSCSSWISTAKMDSSNWTWCSLQFLVIKCFWVLQNPIGEKKFYLAISIKHE